MVGGWFVGDFEPTAYRTSAAEVCYKKHYRGERWLAHYHAQADEINFLIRGRMSICGQEMVAGDIFVIEKIEVAAPEFLEDCELVVVKVPSVRGDKHIV